MDASNRSGQPQPDAQSGAPAWVDFPIFIWGMQKTGSSLLHSLVDGHPSLVVYPVELHIKHFLGKSGSESEADLRRRYLSGEWKGRPVNRLRVAAARVGRGEAAPLETLPHEALVAAFNLGGYLADVAESMGSATDAPEDLFKREIIVFHRNLRRPPAEPVGWAFKMVGGNPSVARAFFSSFPRGRMICIVRDPRGGASSRLKDWSSKGRSVEEARLLAFMLKYRDHWRRLSGLMADFPRDRLLVLRYEDIVSETEAVMRGACDFMGVPFNPCALVPSTLGEPARVWNATSEKAGIFSDSAHDWKTRLTPRQRRLVETVFREFWGRRPFGYAPTLRRSSLFWTSLALNLNRGLIASLRSALPSYVGFRRI